MTLYYLCQKPSDLEELIKMDFGTILTWLELKKADEEIQHIQNEHFKKNNSIKK